MEEVLILDRLTYIYSQLWDKGQAEVYSRRALAIRESTFGARHPYTATGMEYLAGLLDSMGRHEEADVFMRRATEIRSAVLEPGDSDLSTILINQAQHLHITQSVPTPRTPRTQPDRRRTPASALDAVLVLRASA